MSVEMLSRERKLSSQKMYANTEVTCPRCQRKMKRKRVTQHFCVQQGRVIFDGKDLLDKE